MRHAHHAPWHVPIDTLEWGRWVADDRSRASTWFRWHGAHPLSLVVEDGRDHHASDIDAAHALGSHADTARIETATSVLTLAAGRELEHRRLGTILDRIPHLSAIVPATIRALEDTKSLSLATRVDADGSTRTGWAIHETVHFRPPAP